MPSLLTARLEQRLHFFNRFCFSPVLFPRAGDESHTLPRADTPVAAVSMIEVVLNDRLVRTSTRPRHPCSAFRHPQHTQVRPPRRSSNARRSPKPHPSAALPQGKKIRVKCNEDDTVGDLKKLVAAQTGTRPEKIRIQKSYNIYKDHITLEDYEIHDGMGLELYYN